MIEVWKEIAEDPNYLVSNMGRVKSKGRYVNCGPPPGKRYIKGQIINPYRSGGYRQVWLTGRRKESVHGLVAKAFLGSPLAGQEVNHKDGDRANNKVTNLEWVTPQQNIQHSYRELSRKGSCLGRNRKDHPASKAYRRIDPTTNEVKFYHSGRDARDEGFLSSGISACCAGRIATHKGYKWERVEV